MLLSDPRRAYPAQGRRSAWGGAGDCSTGDPAVFADEYQFAACGCLGVAGDAVCVALAGELRQTRGAFQQIFASYVPPIFRPGGFGTADGLFCRRFRSSDASDHLSVCAVSPGIEIKRYTTCKSLQKAAIRLPPGVANAGDKMVPGSNLSIELQLIAEPCCNKASGCPRRGSKAAELDLVGGCLPHSDGSLSSFSHIRM